MFKKTAKIILLFFAGILLEWGLAVCSVQATGEDDLIVEYQTDSGWAELNGPIFNESDFKPGDVVSRRVRVTNNSGESQKIITESGNWPGFPNIDNVPERDLSRALSIRIYKGDQIFYGGEDNPKTLFDFYKDGEVYLFDIPNATSVEYDYEIGFPIEKENEWQGATTSFDILIGFQGKEGVAGRSILLPHNLTILEESATTSHISTTSVTIEWNTSYLSTSQVIYAKEGENHTLNLSDNQGNPPKYGYAHTTPEYDTDQKVISHRVVIDNLEEGVTYYYRCVSHGSLAVSREYKFSIPKREDFDKKTSSFREGSSSSSVLSDNSGETARDEKSIRDIALKGWSESPKSKSEIASPREDEGKQEKDLSDRNTLSTMIASIGGLWGKITRSSLGTILLVLFLLGALIKGWNFVRKTKP